MKRALLLSGIISAAVGYTFNTSAVEVWRYSSQIGYLDFLAPSGSGLFSSSVYDAVVTGISFTAANPANPNLVAPVFTEANINANSASIIWNTQKISLINPTVVAGNPSISPEGIIFSDNTVTFVVPFNQYTYNEASGPISWTFAGTFNVGAPELPSHGVTALFSLAIVGLAFTRKKIFAS